MQNMISIGKMETGEDLRIDLDRLISTRLLIAANSGGGKSWTIRKLLEETHGKVQHIVLDIEGEFSTLREKYDYLLIGKEGEGDIPINLKTAELLAKKILELKVSVIIDLYELKHYDRLRFAKLFLDSLINAPKDLRHPCLVIIDEAHTFCPEKGKGESEASGSVIELATKGRKRGLCAVLATQRLAKLNKDAAAEMGNKLIGRITLDVDRKRAGEELGFTTKEQILSLRDLNDGLFFAFGSAISKDVIKAKIGMVKTTHPEVGQTTFEIPKMTENIKNILSKLTDLPQEAEKDLKDKQEMMRRIRELEVELRKKPIIIDESKVEKAKKDGIAIGQKIASEETKRLMTQNKLLLNKFEQIAKIVDIKIEIPKPPEIKLIPQIAPRQISIQREIQPITLEKGDLSFGRCERSILKFLALREGKSFSKTQIGAMTNYSANSGGFNNAMSKLKTAGLIKASGNSITINSDEISRVIEILGDEYNAPEQDALESWLNRLGLCPKKIYQILLEHPSESFTKEQIGEMTGYSANSGGFNNALSNLCTLGLAVRSGGQIMLNQELLGV